VPGFLAQGHELVEHAARGARDHQGALDHVHGDVLVGHLQVRLEHEEDLAALREAVVEERIVERQAVGGVGQVVLGLGLRLGDEDAARDAPGIGIGTPSGGLAPLRVLFPVAAEVAAVEELS